MAAALFQYQKLKPEAEAGFNDDELFRRATRNIRYLRSARPVRARVPVGRRRLRLRVPRLRRFLRLKARLVAAAVRKVMRRLKEGQGHFGDLFAGNYLFLQVNPSTPPAVKKYYASVHHGPNSALSTTRFSATAAYYPPPPRPIA